MKTTIKTLALAGLLALGLSSCSKKGDSNVSPAGVSSWNLSGASYTGAAASFASTFLQSETSDGKSSVAIDFPTVPTTSGTYTVVNDNAQTVEAGQCSIDVKQSDGSAYVPVGGGTATVTISGGKVAVSFSNISLHLINGPGAGTATITGKLSQ